MATLSEIALVAIGGAVGCVSRYEADQLNIFADKIYNTLFINITGCLLIGILWSLLDKANATSGLIYRTAVTGLLGGFTTFSAFSLHPVLMMRDGNISEALLYVLLSVAGGIAACAAGLFITDKMIN